MRGIWEFIWGGILAIGRRLRDLLAWMWTILTNFLTWVCGAIAYLLDQVADWINDALHDGISTILGQFSDVGTMDGLGIAPLAQYYLDVFDLGYACTLLLALIGAWCAARVARLGMVPIRAILELL